MYYNYTHTKKTTYTTHFHIFAMIILVLCSITPSSILKEMESVLPFTSLIVSYLLLSLPPFSSAVRLFLVFDFGAIFRLQSIRLYSIAILLRPASQ